MSTSLSFASYSLAHNISHVTSDAYLIHSHPCYELYYFLSGNVHFLYANAEYEMQPHTLVVIAPNVFHGIHVLSADTYERFTFHFTEEMISLNHRRLLMGGLPTEKTIRNGTSSIPCMISGADSLGILSLMKDVECINGMPQDVCEQMASVIMEAILGQLLLHGGNLHSAASTSDSEYDNSEYHELKPVLAYIHQHLAEKMTLDDLCLCAHVSKNKLNQLFHQHLGTTAMAYVTRCRLNYAQQLLINGFSATQASSTSGFGDYASFYRAYVKHMGHSPIDDKRTGKESALLQIRNDGSEAMPHQPGSGAKEPDIWLLRKATDIGNPGVLVNRS